MKTRYLLFLTSCLCGIALSLSVSYAHTGDGRENAAPQPSPSAISTIDEQMAFTLATRLVGDRDAALVAHDLTALQNLTVPNSPARRLDDALFENVGDLSALNTVVLDVHVHSETEWEVYSVQQEISTPQGSASSGQERCTLWRMQANPWRLYETSDCG